jgi:hypothetical protein
MELHLGGLSRCFIFYKREELLVEATRLLVQLIAEPVQAAALGWCAFGFACQQF